MMKKLLPCYLVWLFIAVLTQCSQGAQYTCEDLGDVMDRTGLQCVCKAPHIDNPLSVPKLASWVQTVSSNIYWVSFKCDLPLMRRRHVPLRLWRVRRRLQ